MDSKRLINSNCKQDLRHIIHFPSRLFPIFPTLTVFHEHYLFFSINYTKLIPISKHWTYYSCQKLCSSNPIFPWLPASVIKWKLKSSPLSHMDNIFLYDIYEQIKVLVYFSYLLYPAAIRIKFVQSSDLSCLLLKYGVYRTVSF